MHVTIYNLWNLPLFLIILFASDTYNLDYMYPYRVLVDIIRKNVLEGKCRHNNVGGHSCVLSRVSSRSTCKQLPSPK